MSTFSSAPAAILFAVVQRARGPFHVMVKGVRWARAERCLIFRNQNGWTFRFEA